MAASNSAADASSIRPLSPFPRPTMSTANTTAPSVLALDRKVVQSLFTSLRTFIPSEVQRRLLRDAAEELKFLIARQPRLSSFHHRRRESMRHPALAMATKNYYQRCRRKRLELAVQSVTAEHLQQQQQLLQEGTAQPALQAESAAASAWGAGPPRENNTDATAAQRERELVDLLLAEYAESGGFREEASWWNHLSPALSTTELAGFMDGAWLGSRGLAGRNETSLSAAGMRGDGGVYGAELGNRSPDSASGTLRRGGSTFQHFNNDSTTSVTLPSESLGLISVSRSFHGGGNGSTVLPPFEGSLYSSNINGAGGHGRGMRGAPGPSVSIGGGGGAGRFFTKRRDRAEGGTGGRRGNAGKESQPGWPPEMHAALVRRAEEELRAGTGADPYLLTSSRPIELLLCCYGGVRRDSAVLSLTAAFMPALLDNAAAASPATAAAATSDSLYKVLMEEDLRWEQLAQCYRQLLCGSLTACQAAAAIVAEDALVNDIIHRFWTRLTVSAAAQQVHRAQEVHKTRGVVDAAAAAAAMRRMPSALHGGENDEDDLDEIQRTSDGAGEQSSLNGLEPKPRRRSLRSFVRGGDRRDSASDGITKPGTGVRKRKKKTTVAGGHGAGLDAAAVAAAGIDLGSSVAFYMTPLQYVYLHTRIAHVLLPDTDAAEMELLPCIQEDLLIDAAYNENDHLQTLYFGNAPRLSGGGSRGGAETANSAVEKRGIRSGGGMGEIGGRQQGGSAGSADAAHGATSLRQQFLTVRRYGHTLSWRNQDGDNTVGLKDFSGGGLHDNNDNESRTNSVGRHPSFVDRKRSNGAPASHGDSSDSSEGNETDLHGSSAPPDQQLGTALPLTPTCYSLRDLPSLTYPQFWCSMMELADNWTCCAGHPTETAVFLWELYAEVFGHNWSAEDEVLSKAVDRKNASVKDTERAEMEAEVADVLRSFHQLVETLNSRKREARQRADSDNGKDGDDPSSGLKDGTGQSRRRRRGKGKGGRSSRDGSSASAAWSSSVSSPSSSDLTPVEWDALTKSAKHGNAGDWTYVEHMDADGVKRRYRRRVVHHEPRHHHRHHRRHNSDALSIEASYILEEEMNADGTKIRQRKRRCKSGDTERQKHRGHGPTASGHSLRSVDSGGFHESSSERLLRPEPRQRARSRRGSGPSSMTSWTSIDDGTAEDRHNGQKRRHHTRHVDRQGGRPHSGSYSSSSPSSSDENTGISPSSYDAASASFTVQTRLTREELQELRTNKDWLCGVLGMKGIHLPPRMFGDPSEQVLLFELLRLAKENEAGKTEGSGAGDGDGADLFRVDGGDVVAGSGSDGLSRLASHLARSSAFNLDDVEGSAVMRRLLGESEQASEFLTPEQLQRILLALASARSAASNGANNEGGQRDMAAERVQHRQEVLLHIVEDRRAQRSQRDQTTPDKNTTVGAVVGSAGDGEASKATLPGDTAKKETFGLTEVPHTPTQPATASAPIKPLPKVKTEASLPKAPLKEERVTKEALPPASGMVITGLKRDLRYVPTQSRQPQRVAASSTAGANTEHYAKTKEWMLSPSTLAERREQERLFRDLETYWTERASRGGRYQVDIKEYTPQQLDEFFSHLHLGPRQRALLRGRAPLAAATSLVGGTLHQDNAQLLSSHTVRPSPLRATFPPPLPAYASYIPPAPFASAPVKLFTLTTEASLDEALRHSCQSYLEDKAFNEALHDAVRLDVAPTAFYAVRHSSTTLPPTRMLPVLAHSKQKSRVDGAHGGTSDPSFAVSRAVAAPQNSAAPSSAASSSTRPPQPTPGGTSPPKMA